MSEMLSVTPVSKDLARLMSATGIVTELTREQALHLGQKLVRFGLFRGADTPVPVGPAARG